MRVIKNRKIVWVLFMLLLFISPAFSQYKVEGGEKEPLLAIDDKANRIQVYLVYGIESVTISYTSSSSSHQWHRYNTKIIEGGKIESSQQGNTSVIRNLEEGYGYGVVEGDLFNSSSYIWLIDYSNYPVNIQNLHVNPETDPCIGFQLDGSDLTPPLSYHTPGGNVVDIPREFEVEYSSLTWDEAGKQFRDTLIIETIDHPIRYSLNEIPLQDTDIRLKGDLFAAHFGVTKEYYIDYFEAAKLDVHVEEFISEGATNMGSSDNETELVAPAERRFIAHANTPVASFFLWQVFESSDMNTPLVRYTEQEMTYTFNHFGDYTVTLQVSNRGNTCEYNEYTCNVRITETELSVPNAFTPNDDGMNDFFRVAHKSVLSFKASIFNRWGSELFHWSDPTQAWDGKYRGKPVPAGPYFYVIEYTGTDGKRRKKSGDINVIHVKKGENITE